jgi:proteasome lid subunit RPN8/RPN11
MINIPTAIAQEMARHAISSYASESCGLLFASQGTTQASRCICMENLQDRYHQRLPEDFPRTSRDAFKIDERDASRLQQQALQQGEYLMAIFHSHIDCGAYFSDEDKLMAAPFGAPSDPDMWHVVIDCQADGVHGAKAYKWDGEDFAETILIEFPQVLKQA